MRDRTAVLTLVCCVAALSLSAQTPGHASGKGIIERLLPSGSSEQVAFTPRFSYAYSEGAGAKRSTWVVLTEKEPPVKNWLAAQDPAEARRLWCGTEKTPFVALKLDAEWKVDLCFLCPANGAVNTEMLSSWNGLESVVVNFEIRDQKRLKGTMRTGTGSCPGPDGRQAYCAQTGDYAFDAAFSK
jgi:hypothetical protein